jgi:secondary thiamine-phosphate synthase enzyme
VERVSLKTSRRKEWVDITDLLGEAVARLDLSAGAALVFVPHTTAGVTVNEGADPAVAEDLAGGLCRLVPAAGPYRHAEGNSDAHAQTLLAGPSLLLPVEGGRVRLGTWQRVFFCEFDGPRAREVWVQALPLRE